MLKQLNNAQKEAVTHIDGPLLILAGAGSGKTKTLTTRLAYLIGEVGIDPINTLTLTFTNKAANQMRQRALSLIKNANTVPLLCTFHKFGLLFLKLYIDKIDRKNNFNIIDSDDKKKLLKNIMKDLNVDLQIPFINSEISKYKNILLTPKEAIKNAELNDYKIASLIYEEYEKRLIENNLVDFDDLLLLTYKILLNDEDLANKISNKYQYIMVDEYQDTNELQYNLLKILSKNHNNLCVVGDDDQSIYGWRGANIRNILDFNKDFLDAKIVKLEINYRSTKAILDAANSLIEHNRNRLGKRLISHIGEGDKVKLMHSLDESYEAATIAKEIKLLISKGVNPNEIAILYRINALSRSLEEGFTKAKLNFKLIGGIRFYERAEIKDIVSYLRVISNPNDDFSLLRIINKPKRGIGNTTLEKIKNYANKNNLTIFQTLKSEELSLLISKKAYKEIKELIFTIELLKKEKNNLEELINLFDEHIKIKEFYASMPDGFERVLNIDEFFGYFRDSINKNKKLDLEQFLAEITLQSEQDQVQEDSINIMSIHASKGLEFEHVYVIGMEEEFFPLLGDGNNIEEERRLAYVAITRAKKHLTLCYINSRFYKGKRKFVKKSRFLGEAGLIKDASLKNNQIKEFKKGDLVKHKIFGIGRIQEVSRSGKEYKLKINFGGIKKDILSSFVERMNG